MGRAGRGGVLFGNGRGAGTFSRRLRPPGRGSDTARVDGQQACILFDPLGGQAVERTFDVEFLIADHAADAHDEVIETFGRSPKIADANLRIVEIRVEDRREHAAGGVPDDSVDRAEAPQPQQPRGTR